MEPRRRSPMLFDNGDRSRSTGPRSGPARTRKEREKNERSDRDRKKGGLERRDDARQVDRRLFAFQVADPVSILWLYTGEAVFRLLRLTRRFLCPDLHSSCPPTRKRQPENFVFL